MLLMIDNYDSFTYNLVQYFGELGQDVRVFRNDEITLEGIAELRPERLVLSPGPCSPAEAGICVEAIRHFAGKLPLLGVCLGHQAIGAALGGRIVRARCRCTARRARSRTDGRGVFHGLPEQFSVIRYHSLAIERESLPRELVVTATSEDGEIMGVRHRHAGAGRRAVPPRIDPQRTWACDAEELPGAGALNTIDLRSDTVTKPTAAMRAAMAAAEVGDDVFGDDPSVNALQERIAAMLGKEAALFVPTGTQGNLCALMAHCQRGDEVLVGQMAHTYRWEGGGAAVLGSIQPQPLPQQSDGSIALGDIAAAIKPDDAHFARTRLLALENTWGGQILPQAYVEAATALARSRGLATHLDGARLFNAAVASGVPAAEIARHFDSVSVCFSKGLGAPVGSALVGSRELVARAHRIRKMLGGGMRQAGVLAAAALHALDHHIDRLAEDHANARALAEGLSGLPGVSVTPPQTNILFVDLAPEKAAGVVERLRDAGVLCTGLLRLRFVTHLDVSAADIDRAVVLLRQHL